jgi:hypothetical protein
MGQRMASRLTCQDPRIRHKYSELYRPFVQRHRLDMRSYQLQATIVGSLSTQQAIEYESISALRSRGMEYATHGCRKLRMGAVAWYPELQLLRNRILVWNL